MDPLSSAVAGLHQASNRIAASADEIVQRGAKSHEKIRQSGEQNTAQRFSGLVGTGQQEPSADPEQVKTSINLAAAFGGDGSTGGANGISRDEFSFTRAGGGADDGLIRPMLDMMTGEKAYKASAKIVHESQKTTAVLLNIIS